MYNLLICCSYYLNQCITWYYKGEFSDLIFGSLALTSNRSIESFPVYRRMQESLLFTRKVEIEAIPKL